MTHVNALVLGVVLGLMIAAGVAGWIWLSLTPGNDHPLSEEEIKERIGETWG